MIDEQLTPTNMPRNLIDIYNAIDDKCIPISVIDFLLKHKSDYGTYVEGVNLVVYQRHIIYKLKKGLPDMIKLIKQYPELIGVL